jgi:hypothetical protein
VTRGAACPWSTLLSGWSLYGVLWFQRFAHGFGGAPLALGDP